MTFTVSFQSGIAAAASRALYRKNDLSLDYRHQQVCSLPPDRLADAIDATLGVSRHANYFVIADTMVILFAGGDRELIGVEAYTNWERWLPHKLTPPKVSGQGRVCLSDLLPDDRIDLGVVPKYAYSIATRALRISLVTDQDDVSYYRVSDHLVVGLNDRRLAVLVVEDLTIE